MIGAVSRIFFTLSLFSLLLLLAALGLGLGMGDLYADDLQEATLRWATVHRLTGVAAALGVVFVASIVVTYFVGTSRWCKEVVETYRLDRSYIVRSAQLKRRTFPWSLGSMLLVVGMIAVGAAADPGTGRPTARDWADIHLLASLLGVALILWSYVQQGRNIRANHQIIDEVMAEVARVRTERGLETEEKRVVGS